MQKLVIRNTCFIILFIISGNILEAQQSSPAIPLSVSVDISRFRYSSDTSIVEANYAIYPSGVTLEKINDTLRGAVVISTEIMDLVKDSLVDKSKVSMPIVILDTNSFQSGYIWKCIYLLRAGYYRITVKSYDEKSTGRKDSVTKDLFLPKYGEALTISDIDLCTRIVPSDDKSNLFYKNSYQVVPNPSLLFGSKVTPVVFSYAELYNLVPNQTYCIVSGVIDANGNFVKQQKRMRKYSARNVVDVSSLNIYSIPSAKYKFVLLLTDTNSKELARSEKDIYIYNPHIQINSGPVSVSAIDFLSYSDSEIIDEFKKAKYIATSDDIDAFKKLNTPEARREFLANFWKEVEARYRGRGDITRAFYMDRVNRASQKFSLGSQDGWKTDRGRIYVLYGEPDEIQRFPSSESGKPYEIWYYNQIEGGVYFVFVDRTGFGNYELVHSTKRGEVWDADWERNLQ